MEAILGAKTFQILDDFQSNDIVIKRLKRMKEERQKKESKKDPFQKTFLERIRELLGCGIDGRQHAIKAKLRWFASDDWRRDEIAGEIDKQMKLNNMKASFNDISCQAVDYNDPDLIRMQGKTSEEYNSLVRKDTAQSNDLDFSVSGSHKIELAGPKQEIKAICAETKDESTKKTTSELFLSVQTYVQEKAKQGGENIENSASFAGTKLWAQSDEYLPGEKWDPEHQSFSEIQVTAKLEAGETASIDESSESIAFLLTQQNPQLLAVDLF